MNLRVISKHYTVILLQIIKAVIRNENDIVMIGCCEV